MLRSEFVSWVIMNRPPERPIDEQWAVIKRAHERGWWSSRLTANEFAREAVIACDSCAVNDSMRILGTRIIQDSPTVVETSLLNRQSEYFSWLDYVLSLYIIYL